MGRQPREWLVLHLLQQHWDNSNTFGVTPDISFGWWDEAKNQPQLTVGVPDEGPTGGGTTGYDAIDGSGGTPHQTIDGVIDVHCWGRDRDLDNASTSFARQYYSGDSDGTNHGALDELKDVIQANAQSPKDPVTGNRPVWSIAPLGSNEAPQSDVGDEVVHFVASVGYQFGRD